MNIKDLQEELRILERENTRLRARLTGATGMTLAQWLGYHQKTQAWLIEALEANPGSVSEYVRGIRSPGMKTAQRIYALTDGEVGLMNWPG